MEHAFQALKTNNIDEQEIIRLLPTPGQAKRMGRKVTLRSDWESVKESIMKELVREKFLQNNNLKTMLLQTEDAFLEETNNWNDVVWGVCNGRGQNKLGKILMKIREELKKG